MTKDVRYIEHRVPLYNGLRFPLQCCHIAHTLTFLHFRYSRLCFAARAHAEDKAEEASSCETRDRPLSKPYTSTITSS